MANNSQALFHLQQLSTELSECSAHLAAIQTELTDDTAQRRLEIAVKAQRGVLLKNESEQKKFTQEATATSNKIKEDEQRLYQGKVKSPKELVELQTEIAHQKARLIEIEENAFECLTENESIQEKLDELTTEFQQFAADHEIKMANLRAQVVKIKDRLDKLKVEVGSQRSLIPAELVAHFDRLYLSKNKIAVAAVDEDSCSICGTLLSKQVIISSRSAQVPNTCPTCNRFLYNEH